MKQALLDELIVSLGIALKNIGEKIMSTKFEGLAANTEQLRELIDHMEGALKMRRLIND